MQALRDEIFDLYRQRALGDLPERRFHQLVGPKVMALCRAAVEKCASPGEVIRLEHHVIRAHSKLASSVFKESDQEPISLYASDSHLYRLRSMLPAEQPVSCDEKDHTHVERLPLSCVTGIEKRYEWRWGQAAAGVVIVAVAWLFGRYLEFTGSALLLIGILGTLHALLFPTRWLEIKTSSQELPSFQILTLRKKSARKLTTFLREKLSPS